MVASLARVGASPSEASSDRWSLHAAGNGDGSSRITVWGPSPPNFFSLVNKLKLLGPLIGWDEHASTSQKRMMRGAASFDQLEIK